MSNRPKHFDTKPSSPHHRPRRRSSRISSKTLLKWTAIILVVLLLFWLFIAEDIDAYIGWGNP